MAEHQTDAQRKRVIDTLTEAALERDQASYADWWMILERVPFGRQAAEASFRRGYAAAWESGAGASDRRADR